MTRDCVAAFHTAAGRNPYDRALTDLIGELSTRSETFRALSATHDVGLHRTGLKRLRRSEVGVLALDYDVMELVQAPGLVFIAYSAAPSTPAADGLALLASLAATHHPYEPATPRS